LVSPFFKCRFWLRLRSANELFRRLSGAEELKFKLPDQSLQLFSITVQLCSCGGGLMRAAGGILNNLGDLLQKLALMLLNPNRKKRYVNCSKINILNKNGTSARNPI
jgi:hypothetical protein